MHNNCIFKKRTDLLFVQLFTDDDDHILSDSHRFYRQLTGGGIKFQPLSPFIQQEALDPVNFSAGRILQKIFCDRLSPLHLCLLIHKIKRLKDFLLTQIQLPPTLCMKTTFGNNLPFFIGQVFPLFPENILLRIQSPAALNAFQCPV